jgi:hypothetical protein
MDQPINDGDLSVATRTLKVIDIEDMNVEGYFTFRSCRIDFTVEDFGSDHIFRLKEEDWDFSNLKDLKEKLINSKAFERALHDEVSDYLMDKAENELYQADPYKYYGVRRADFI